MSQISGTFRNGRVELDSSVDWPNGARVTVLPQIDEEEPTGTRLPSARLTDGTLTSWLETPEFRQALIAQMDGREPVELTAEEESQWQADRSWIREHTIESVRKEMGLNP